ncbi:hypothetical protein CTI12_AA324400 [Artemisia annua]|uniref:Uncharacterized protein n=1 Tax=Artemisia annua TaxID=35608 RepID=A0A2U1MYX7_ARTAN|nr:hypothetical protein CTI12_AA324400 [Artemisia annua]
MGKLWMVFKKYGMVFYMFMGQRRLRNGKRYGFIRYKSVKDVEGLLSQLQKIKLGNEYLRVHVAYDRNHNDNGRMGGHDKKQETTKMTGNWERNDMNEGRVHIRDARTFVDVVNTGNARRKWMYMEKGADVTNTRHDTGSKEPHDFQNQKGFMDNCGDRAGNERVGRTIIIDDKDLNSEMLKRSVAGEVKATCFLHNLPALCVEQGLNNVEVKLLGGLEVMVVMENAETANNVLEDKDHGLRRWLHKLKKGSSITRTAGRMTWINIMGILISCWNVETFKKIAALHGTILGTSNCSLEGNQSIIYGRVHIRTIKKGLIRKELNMKVQGKIHKVSVVKEIRDIHKIVFQDNSKLRQDSKLEEGEVDMMKDNVSQHEDEKVDDEGDSNSKGEDSSDEEADDMANVNCPVKNHDGRNQEGDEGSRFSGETKVEETIDADFCSSKKSGNETSKEAHREYNNNKCDGGNLDCGPNVAFMGTHDAKETNEVNLEKDADKNNNVDSKCDEEVGQANIPNEKLFIPMDPNQLFNNSCNVLGPNHLFNNACNELGSKPLPNNIGNDMNSQQIIKEDFNDKVNTTDQEGTARRREKREMSPTSSMELNESKLKKKMKASMFNESVEGSIERPFDLGIKSDEIQNINVRMGRRSMRKVKELARKAGVERLGDDTKGTPDAYKEVIEVDGDNGEVFKFGDNHVNGECKAKWDISIDQIKEVGELIGISWAEAENERIDGV